MGVLIQLKKVEKTEANKSIDAAAETTDLELIAKKNKENKERVQKERIENNKKVLRSYRIKN